MKSAICLKKLTTAKIEVNCLVGYNRFNSAKRTGPAAAKRHGDVNVNAFLDNAKWLLTACQILYSILPICRQGLLSRHCVGLSVSRSVRSHLAFLAFLSCLKVEKFRYEYFMDINAPALINVVCMCVCV